MLCFSSHFSANTTVADSPFLISQDEANQAINEAANDGVAEPLTDSSKHFFSPHNVFAKL